MSSASPVPRPLDPLQTGHYVVNFAESNAVQGVVLPSENVLRDAQKIEIVTSNPEDVLLKFRKGNERHTLHGCQKLQTASYILELDDGLGSVVLRPVENDYEFSSSPPRESQSTDPSNISRGSLSPATESQDAQQLEGPDKNNPFDYRHYLSGPGPVEAEDASRLASRNGTPLLASSSFAISPRGAASDMEGKRASSAAATPKQARRNVLARLQASRRTPATKAIGVRAQANRGTLIIEDSSPPTPKRQRVFTNGDGPRCLDSATSTPAISVEPAKAPRTEAKQTWSQVHASDGEEELDDDEEADEVEGEEDDEEEADADVDDFELPSPSQRIPGRQQSWDAEELCDLLDQLDPPLEEAAFQRAEEEIEVESEEE